MSTILYRSAISLFPDTIKRLTVKLFFRYFPEHFSRINFGTLDRRFFLSTTGKSLSKNLLEWKKLSMKSIRKRKNEGRMKELLNSWKRKTLFFEFQDDWTHKTVPDDCPFTVINFNYRSFALVHFPSPQFSHIFRLCNWIIKNLGFCSLEHE